MSRLGGIFDYDGRKERLEEVLLRLEDPNIWDDPQEAQQLGQERASLETSTTALEDLALKTAEASELLVMAREEGDGESLELISIETDRRFYNWKSSSS